MTSTRQVATTLAEAGVASPQHDARVLMRHAEKHDLALDELVARRAARVPLQHLVGSVGFRYLDLDVGPGVFIPRPETELLVDAVLAATRETTNPTVVDLCAGSGAIGLSVAHEHPTVQVHLVERSADAYAWLVRNAGSRNRVHLHLADLAAAPTGLDRSVDVVVSNPPYVPLDERDLVAPEVRDHDPADALWGGPSGLDVIVRVVERAVELLRPGGTLVIEHSDRHGKSVAAMCEASGFIDVEDHQDLTGRPRFTVGLRPW
jgi:release factor glutamine methyltransferase